MISAIANRYARALADVMGPTGDYRAVRSEIEDFQDLYHRVPELRQAMESPFVSPLQKRQILDAILRRCGTSQVASNFLRVLQAHYRLSSLDSVVEAFRRVSNQRLGIVEMQVESSRDLEPVEQEALRTRFAQLTGRTIKIEFHRNPSLLGGLRAQCESTVYDGSVRGYLERIGRGLRAG